MYLSELNMGDKAFLISNQNPTPLLSRLIDMGLSPQSPIECLFESLSGSMRAYSIGETAIALRQKEARHIKVCK